jgi:ABC-type multidrug transport system fused ATPase/permease subunit
MRLPLISLPHNMSQMGNYMNSFQRFSEYLLLDDLSATTPMPADDDSALRIANASFTWVSPTAPGKENSGTSEKGKKDKGKDKSVKEGAGKPAKALSSKSFASMSEPFSMSDVSLSLPRHGHLTAIVGRVGSGKTSLLSRFVAFSYVGVYVCVCVCVYVCMYVCMHLYIYVYTYICICVCIHVGFVY